MPLPPRRLLAWSAAAAYTGEWREWIRRFKYPGRGLRALDPAADAVACWLATEAAAALPAGLAPDAVVPVPLHPRRRRERGFDQAAILAQAICRDLDLPRARPLLERTRDTARQTGLSRPERRRNLRAAFAARGPAPGRVWLVDDVATTGATLSEAARALRRAGCRQIVGICCAHTPRGVDDAP